MERVYEPRVSRRKLFLTGGGALGVAALAACTDNDPSSGAFGNTGSTDLMESPMLTELIEAGELPELSERLPDEPMVIEPWNSAGRFGGTLNRAASGQRTMANFHSFSTAGLLEWNWEGDGQIPSLAAEYDKDEENRTFSFKLRDGLKWSDGEPFTTEDIRFQWEDVLGNEAVTPVPPHWLANPDGSMAELAIVDEVNFQIVFDESTSLFERYLCFPNRGGDLIVPKHYLEQFHPDYASESELDTKVSDAGFGTWQDLFENRRVPWTNAEIPVMGAYKAIGDFDSQGVALMERNSYFWKTDPDGRQLPYIDSIQVQQLDQETLDLRAANGDLDFQVDDLGYKNAQVLIQNAEENGYELRRWGLEDRLITLFLNLSHPDESIREIFHEYDFRVALSLAIDREDLNSTLLGGLGEIRQPVPTADSDFYIEGGGEKHTQRDIDEANRLLDGLGMDRGSDGMRTRPDGSPLSLVVISRLDLAGVSFADTLNRVVGYWAEVGINLTHNAMDNTLYTETYMSNEFDIDASDVMKTDNFDMEPVWFVPISAGSHSCPAYGMWYQSSGEDGLEPTDDFKALLQTWESLESAPTDEARIEAGLSIAQQHIDNLYVIGVIGQPFQPAAVANRIQNVRDDEEPMHSSFHGRERFTKPEQLYFADGE